MKKIVALVLCLVLALSLCTVAMADSLVVGTTSSKSIDATGYKLLEISANNDNKDMGTIDLIMHATKTNTVEVKGSTTTTTYYADMYTITYGENDTVDKFFEVDKSFATYKLIKGSETVWLRFMGAVADYAVETTIKADKKVDAVTDPDCGEYDKTTYANGVYVAGTKAYEAAADVTGDWAVYNNKFVAIADKDTTATAHPHNWTKVQVTFDKAGTAGEPISIVCDDCDKSFKIVDSLVDHNGDATTFVKCADDAVLGQVGHLDGYYVILKADSAVAAGSSTSTTVESAKTFDAGIALYAGMALASVAGSAVVIGKKKEF